MTTPRPNLTSKPVTWADGIKADVVDPGTAKQIIGWLDLEPVNNGHVNEMQRRLGEMLEYLDQSGAKQRNYVRGVGDEGLVLAWSAVDLTATLNDFVAIVDGQEHTVTGASFLVTTSADNQIWTVYLDSAGIAQVVVGAFFGTQSYESRPQPDGALLFRFTLNAAVVNFSTPPDDVKDMRARDPHAAWEFLEEASTDTANYGTVTVWDADVEHVDKGLPAPLPGGLRRIANSTVSIDGGGEKVGGFNKNTCATTGLSVILGGNATGDPKRFNRLLNTLEATYTLQQVNTLGVRKVVTDGDRVCVIHDTYVELFEMDGTPAWDFNHTAQLNDVWLTRQFVYICGAEVGGTISVRKLNRSDGAVQWSYDHGNDVFAIWADDVVCHIDGAVSAHVSGATFRILNAFSGSDLTNEGGTGTDTAQLAMNAVDGVTDPEQYSFVEAPDGALYRSSKITAAPGRIAEHGRRASVWISSGLNTIPEGRSSTCFGVGQPSLSADHEFVFFNADAARLACLRRDTMTVVWTLDRTGGAVDNIYGIATDGQMLFVDSGLAVGTTTLQSRNRGNRYPVEYQKFTNILDGSAVTRRGLMLPTK